MKNFINISDLEKIEVKNGVLYAPGYKNQSIDIQVNLVHPVAIAIAIGTKYKMLNDSINIPVLEAFMASEKFTFSNVQDGWSIYLAESVNSELSIEDIVEDIVEDVVTNIVTKYDIVEDVVEDVVVEDVVVENVIGYNTPLHRFRCGIMPNSSSSLRLKVSIKDQRAIIGHNDGEDAKYTVTSIIGNTIMLVKTENIKRGNTCTFKNFNGNIVRVFASKELVARMKYPCDMDIILNQDGSMIMQVLPEVQKPVNEPVSVPEVHVPVVQKPVNEPVVQKPDTGTIYVLDGVVKSSIDLDFTTFTIHQDEWDIKLIKGGKDSFTSIELIKLIGNRKLDFYIDNDELIIDNDKTVITSNDTTPATVDRSLVLTETTETQTQYISTSVNVAKNVTVLDKLTDLINTGVSPTPATVGHANKAFHIASNPMLSAFANAKQKK